MSVYDPFEDIPNKIISEGQQISITFTKVSATSADISWTLPADLDSINYPPSVYNGIVIVLDTVPIVAAQTPVDGKFYVADYTADPDLHLGSKIGTGLVVGAFYDDKTTTSVTIQGVEPSVEYYVAGFAVDNVTRYHTAGVRTYSLELALNEPGADTSGFNLVKLGVQNTDSTGLLPTNNYTLYVTIDGISYTWNFLGSTIPTYQDLIDAINFKIATIDNPYSGAIPQGTNGLYVDLPNKKLYQWDGFHNNLLAAYFGDPAPNTSRRSCQSPGFGSGSRAATAAVGDQATGSDLHRRIYCRAQGWGQRQRAGSGRFGYAGQGRTGRRRDGAVQAG